MRKPKHSIRDVIRFLEARQLEEDWDIRQDAIYYLREYLLFTEEKTAKVVNYVCDHCGFWLTDGIMDYCPGCGAKLEWKNEEH